VAVAVGLLFIGGVSAAAHTTLTSSDPSANATLAAPPAAVTLTFNEDLAASFAAMTVLGADETNWVESPPQVHQRQLRAALTPTAPAGAYTVNYRVVSADGHPVVGSFAFTIGSGAPPVPQAAAASATSTPLGAAESAPAGSSNSDYLSNSGYLQWIGFDVAALGLLAVGGWRRKIERREGSGEP